jgi:signal transduction histidine kinase
VGVLIGLFIQRTRALDSLRKSEEALIRINNLLELRVRERTAELHEANRELSAEIIERTRLEREIIRISEREQRRIGQDLHDGLCQELTAITFMTRALATRLGKNSAHARSNLDETARINEVAHLLNDSVSRCRDIARGLHPVEMDADGLRVALKDLALRTDQTIPCSFRCDEPILMPESDMALNLYRIAQEAVNNAVKYSQAGRITISLDRDGPALRLSIGDNGRGISTRSAAPRGKGGGMGLHIMRYRARTMGATLRVLGRRPQGTEVVCLLPRT